MKGAAFLGGRAVSVVLAAAFSCGVSCATHLARVTVGVGKEGSAALISRDAASPPRDPTWYTDFSEEESTYDEDADNGRAGTVKINKRLLFQAGWSPSVRGTSLSAGANPPGFFHESMSGGPKEAWQTHYPAITKGIAGRDVDLGDWYQRRGGSWQQEYLSGEGGATGHHNIAGELAADQRLSATWFDAGVTQMDGFGRRKFPSGISGRRLVAWQERAVNTTLSCATPGCVANATLQLYNPADTQAMRCKMNVYFHATDFDDEVVEWIRVNDQVIKSSCEVGANGCNASAVNPLRPCLLDFPLDRGFLGPNGRLEVSAKIPTGVDECGYQGNLLSAVPIVTCMVAPIDPSPLSSRPNQPRKEDYMATRMFGANGATEEIVVPLTCSEPGCYASQRVNFYPTPGMEYDSCLMTLTVNQTDFEGEFSTEAIESVQVDSNNVTFVTPTANPCRAADAGTPLTPAQKVFTVVQDADVTLPATTPPRFLVLSAKITEAVDSCPSNGFLLDGLARISCRLSPLQVPAAAL